MSHVIDDLELYTVGALPAERRAAVAAHLRGCATCGAAADDLAEVVAALAEAIPPREPPEALKERILAAAAADVRPRRALRIPALRLEARWLALAAAFLLLLGVAADQALRLQAVEADRRDFERIAALFAGGGRTWYMAGVEEWKGAGGNLMQPGSGLPAFVVFHDLKALSESQVYALWLIAPDGKWVRGTNFRPDGRELQLVAVGQELAGYERCAVTVESATAGKREGPVVMQSRIVPPTQ